MSELSHLKGEETKPLSTSFNVSSSSQNDTKDDKKYNKDSSSSSQSSSVKLIFFFILFDNGTNMGFVFSLLMLN